MQKITVPRQFASDFHAVVTYYGLTDSETAEAKEAARADIENAIVCFASVAKAIK